MDKQLEDEDFTKKIVFLEKAQFHLSGFVNKQNCRVWSSEKPRQIQEREMHLLWVTVSCAFRAEDVIGSFFFEDERVQAVKVNDERYRNTAIDFFLA